MGKFTKKEAKELNTPLPLLNQWEKVMNVLWDFLTKYAKTRDHVTVKAHDNTILYKCSSGHQFVIGVYFYNKKYLVLDVAIEGFPDFEIKVSHINQFGKKGIIYMIGNILTYAESVKPY